MRTNSSEDMEMWETFVTIPHRHSESSEKGRRISSRAHLDKATEKRGLVSFSIRLRRIGSFVKMRPPTMGKPQADYLYPFSEHRNVISDGEMLTKN